MTRVTQKEEVKKKKKRGIVSKLGDGLERVGRGTIGFVQSANRTLDRVGFPKISPQQMIGGQQPQQRTVKTIRQHELMYCPVCNGWKKKPHHHKVIELV